MSESLTGCAGLAEATTAFAAAAFAITRRTVVLGGSGEVGGKIKKYGATQMENCISTLTLGRLFQLGIIVKLFGCPIESAYALVYDADIASFLFLGEKTMPNKLLCYFGESGVFV